MLRTLLAGVALAAWIGGASADDTVTLKIEHFLPPQATVPKNFIKPWADKVSAESGGRIKFEIYPAMQLGGGPPSLYDAMKDGLVDIVWTLPGYTPGRFPKTEAFELPFIATTSAEATSRALEQYYLDELQDEFPDAKMIAMHVHGPGVIHSKPPVMKLEDMKGLKLRGPTRVTNMMLEALGASPVGMPVPAVTEALSKGVIDGTVIPWEVTPSIKVAELVSNHTIFSGDRAFYVATFVFAMNKAKYDSLPDDLKKVIDDNSGMVAADWVGKVMEEGDAPGLKLALGRGNNVITLSEDETRRWQDAAQPIYKKWADDMSAKGLDGQALVDKAKALIDKEAGK